LLAVPSRRLNRSRSQDAALCIVASPLLVGPVVEAGVKKIITIMSRQAARTIVTELAAKGIHGMTLIEAAPRSSLGATTANGAMRDGANGDGANGVAANDGANGDLDHGGAAARVRLETVVESHRADEVIELIEALLDSAEAIEPASARLVVEDVSTVVHIRSGRVLV
jgi:nitrogen regulatory protein PII